MNSHVVLEFLVAQTWQVTLLAGLVWCGTRMIGSRHCHLSHALWLLVLLKCITPPVWSSPAGVFSWLESQRTWQPMPIKDGPQTTPSTAPSAYRVTTQHHHDQNRAASPPLAMPHQGSWWSRIDLRAVLVCIWLVGGTICFSFTVFRYIRFRQMVARGTLIDEGPLAELKEELCKQLAVRKSITLIISDHPIAPAVLGFWRCQIVLPASMIRQFNVEQLKPILAHELIHIRRWDLYWSWLQVGAQAVFWFNPLVRLAAFRVTQDSEQCCDQETVMGIGCPPKTYVSALVAVVEHNRGLLVSPSLPGVRPIDITLARLERVMKLRHGSCCWTPIWVWLVFALASAILLPGAATTAAQESMSNGSTGLPLITLPPASAKDPDSIRYDVRSLLAQLESHDDPAEQLLRYLPTRVVRLPTATPSTEPSIAQDLPPQSPSPEIRDGHLVVHGSKDFQAKIAEALEGLRKFGFTPIVLDAKILEIPRERFLALVEDWPQEKAFAVLNDLEANRFVAQFEENPEENFLVSPKVIVTNGIKATVSTGSEVPYVSGMKKIVGSVTQQPIVELLTIGDTIVFQPRIRNDSQLDLYCKVERSRLDGFTESPESPNDSLTLQIPEVTTLHVKCDVTLTEDASLLIGKFWESKDGVEHFVGALVTARVGVDDETAKNVQETEQSASRR